MTLLSANQPGPFMAVSTLDDPTPPPLSREAVLRFLYDRINYERAQTAGYQTPEFKLDRMRELLSSVGNPQQGMPIVHVAGTKGKGSTSAMIGAALSAAGYRTGVFTSPHLDQIEERWQIDGRIDSPDDTARRLQRLRPIVERMDRQAVAADPPDDGPTYFEITTAMALLHFLEHEVDAAVLEVGLGGRLDSTNVCQPALSVITSISFDHTRQLGNTLESIAREKAGIIKPGVPVVSGVTDPVPRGVIREVCREQGSRLIELGTDFTFAYEPPRRLETAAAPGRLDFEHRTPERAYAHHGLALRLLGHHQAANAAVVLAGLEELRRQGWLVPDEACRTALAEVVWPARAELIARRPAIVIDAAHNVASIEALLRVLAESFCVSRRRLVFATTEEKDVRGMLARLLGQFDDVVFTRYQNNPRGVPPERLQALAVELSGRQWPVFARPAEAWDAIRARAAAEDLICVTGSFFIAAEMRREIGARPAGTPW
jgi:dihydrofolate synthase/folylpolyglutamate synthase